MVNKVALVTGASQGIGKSVAFKLAELGFDLALLARGQDKLHAIKQTIEARFNVLVKIYQVDVGDKHAVKAAVKALFDTFQRIDLLFNNAGIAIKGTSDIDLEDFEQLIQVNLLGAFYVLHSVIPYMKKQGAGYIINLVSRSAVVARSPLGGYAASKFGLRGMSEALYRELSPLGIKVTALHPGVVDTEMTSGKTNKITNANKIKTMDIANTVAYLLQLSPRACVKELVVECVEQTGDH